MNTQDEAAWEREFDHVEERQKQREGWDGKQIKFAGGKTYQLSETTKTTTWGNDDETNNQ